MLDLPRKDKEGVCYLSPSQYASWKKSKRNYIRQYFLGEADDNKSLRKYGTFGTKVGEALEHNDFSGFTEEEQEFLKTIPRYDEFEREIRLDFGGWYAKGFIDTNSLVTRVKKGKELVLVGDLVDYKTGEIHKKKKDYESKEYIQTDLYAAAIWKETGYLPESVSVILIQRDGNAFSGEDLTLGREFIQIHRKVDKKRALEVLKDFEETAKEISEYYKVFKELNFLV